MTDLDGAFDHCARLVRAHDKDRFVADLFAPAERRPFLYALHAFDLEVARVPGLVREPLAGEVRLQWWREALMGAGRGEALAHPVAAAMVRTIAQADLDRDRLLELIDARRLDLYAEPMQDMAALETYVKHTASSLLALAARVCGCGTAAAETVAEPGGLAMGLTALLGAIGWQAARGRILLPRELLDRHGVRTADILAGRATPELAQALSQLAARARVHLAAARAALDGLSELDQVAFLPLALTRPRLDRLTRRGTDPFRGSADLPAWRRYWIIWRAAGDSRRIAV